MAISHHNFGVSEHSDPLDGLLMHTVADLKNPPREPHQALPQHWNTPERAKLRTEGYPLSDTTSFVAE